MLRLKLADEVYEVDKSDSRSWHELWSSLQDREFRRIYCPHESIRSALFVHRLKAFEKIGFKKWWNRFFFTRRVRRPMELPEPLRQLALLTAVDENFARAYAAAASDPGQRNLQTREAVRRWNAAIPAFADIYTAPHPEDVAGAARFLRDSKPAVYIAPGSVWATKKWTENGFVEVAKHYHAKGYAVYWTGSSTERELCQRLADEVPGTVNLAGQTSLVDLHALFTKAALVISNDSSPIHLAAMAGAKCVGIFGATTLSLGFRPWSDRAKVAQIDLNCRPCGLHGHKQCPLKHHHCMVHLPSHLVTDLGDESLAL